MSAEYRNRSDGVGVSVCEKSGVDARSNISTYQYYRIHFDLPLNTAFGVDFAASPSS